MNGWQWHQLNHMQVNCTSLQTDNMPAPHQSSLKSFTGQMLFLPPNQQRQCTEDTGKNATWTETDISSSWSTKTDSKHQNVSHHWRRRDGPVSSGGDSRWNKLTDPHINETDIVQVSRQPLNMSGHVYTKIWRTCQHRLNVFQALQHLREVI